MSPRIDDMSNVEDANAYHVGVLAPLTRPGWTQAGRHLVEGMTMAARDVNDEGGIEGRELRLIVRDTAASPSTAEVAVDEFASIGVEALAGEYHSVVAQAAARRTVAHTIPYLCSSAVIDALVQQPEDWVGRLAPPQSRGWTVFADYLWQVGHKRVVVATEASAYWAAGLRIVRDRFRHHGGSVILFDMSGWIPGALPDELARNGSTALLLLVGFPDAAVRIVAEVRGRADLAHVLIGAPAGQPEFADWQALLGPDGTSVPFLRYMPDKLTNIGSRVNETLRQRLPDPPSFVALEGYDTVLALTHLLRARHHSRAPMSELWPKLNVAGTRGLIRFSRSAETGIWEWTAAPIQLAQRPSDGEGFVVLNRSTCNL